MRLKRLIILIITVLTLCSCGTENSKQTPEVTGEFRFSVLKAGQADAIIMQTETHCVIIDCGEKDDGDDIAAYLADNGIENVDYIFITHFDKDHVGGAKKVLDSVSVEKIITPAYEGTNSEYTKYVNAAGEHNITPTPISEEMSVTLDDVLFEVYPPQKTSYAEGDNDFSLAISVTHGDNRFLFAGDAEKERLSEIMEQVSGEFDFLKVPHHGRYNKKTDEFFASVKPVYAVITDSEKKPAEDKTVAALESIGSSVYYTRNGDVNVTSDGEKIIINQ